MPFWAGAGEPQSSWKDDTGATLYSLVNGGYEVINANTWTATGMVEMIYLKKGTSLYRCFEVTSEGKLARGCAKLVAPGQ